MVQFLKIVLYIGGMEKHAGKCCVTPGWTVV